MEGLQPTSYSTGNPQINIQFRLIVNGSDVAGYLFKSWDVDAFQPQEPYSELITESIDYTRVSAEPSLEREDDAQVVIGGDSVTTWGVATRNPFRLSLGGYRVFEGWVDAARGCPGVVLSGTWSRTY
jgi:hypothetical protein